MSGAVTLLPSTPCTRSSLPSFLRYSSTLKMGAVGSCEMFVPFCLTIKGRIPESSIFFVDTATWCISNLTYRLTCDAIRTLRNVTLLSSLVRLRNGGGTYLTNAPSRRQNQLCDNLKYQGWCAAGLPGRQYGCVLCVGIASFLNHLIRRL